MFSFLTNCQVRAAQKLHEKCMEDTTAGEIGVQVHEGDDFLSGILKHRARGLESGAHSKIWGYAQQELKCA
ncbi:hypothetical protein EON65_24945 [archaeon]|nr:MAG: hypothetical protein EON65_24945 [archaeon]